MRSLLLVSSLWVAFVPHARAVPGPDTTAIIANANVPESVALAMRYAEARDVPSGQVCLLDVPDAIDIPIETFRTNVMAALETCLTDAGAIERLEAVVVMRGIPLRVSWEAEGRSWRSSLAAALGVWKSTMAGAELLGRVGNGTLADCGGGPCYRARFVNPIRAGVFHPGWTMTMDGVEWRPLLVTMLHGRTYEDAGRLLTSAIEGDAMGGARGEFLFMRGADPARAWRDPDNPDAIVDLMARGFTDVREVPFDANLTGHTLAAFFTGTASIGETIEGNTFLPGSIVDNVTSFGAVPENFAESGEVQVSIARWVAQGVAGVHGTTDEPLADAFPRRRVVVAYADGATLAESYLRAMPYVYWHNLVLGDPMLAPYAVRPVVTIEGVAEGATVTDGVEIAVSAADAEHIGVDSLTLYANGRELAHADGDRIDFCLGVPDGETWTLLAVAQKRDDLTDRGLYRPKGWLAVDVTGGPGDKACREGTDAGTTPDAGAPAVDAGAPLAMLEDEGCGCRASSASSVLAAPLLFAVLFTRRSGRWSRARRAAHGR
jgi:uncharacterized protein (TIGR03790 family)